MRAAADDAWRVERAGRFACLVDGAAYYSRVHEVLQRARHRVFLVGWDFDSRVRLERSAVEEEEDVPSRLGAFLDHLVRTRDGLHVHILGWNAAAVFAHERELGLPLRMGWKTHERVHFQYVRHHPLGGCHHQKIIVVDDALAFSGGLDLTAHRWDRPIHAVEDELRHDRGRAHGPYHDVQAVCTGPVAAALGELVREVWRTASDVPAGESRPGAADELWPEDLRPDLVDVPTAIARTRPAFDGLPPVREVERSYLRAIGEARASIYAENQYLTSKSIVDALGARLEQSDGPEVVLVVPQTITGWVQQSTLGAAAVRRVAALRERDRHGRLRVLSPFASRAADVEVFVHSKVMVVDDRLLRIGSANLCNRSMTLDSECDLEVRSETEAHRRAIARVRTRLLAHHLGVSAERVSGVLETSRTLTGAIDELSGGDRTLVEFEVPDVLPPEPALTPDMEGPIELTRVLERLTDEVEDGRARPWPALAATFLLLAAAFGFALAWRFARSAGWVGEADVSRLAAVAEAVSATPLLALLLFVAGSHLAVPLNLMVLLAVLAFGGLEGWGLAYAGALLGAVSVYGTGRVLGADIARRLAGRHVDRIGRRLLRRGILAVTAVRILPVAPATFVHLVCGAARVRFGAYVLGSALGLLPGVTILALFGEGLLRLLRAAGPESLLLLFAPAGAVLGLALWIDRRILLRRDRGSRPA